jgi:hypothetical protein
MSSTAGLGLANVLVGLTFFAAGTVIGVAGLVGGLPSYLMGRYVDARDQRIYDAEQNRFLKSIADGMHVYWHGPESQYVHDNLLEMRRDLGIGAARLRTYNPASASVEAKGKLRSGEAVPSHPVDSVR